jgi:hypothetical protein
VPEQKSARRGLPSERYWIYELNHRSLEPLRPRTKNWKCYNLSRRPEELPRSSLGVPVALRCYPTERASVATDSGISGPDIDDGVATETEAGPFPKAIAPKGVLPLRSVIPAEGDR